MNAAVHKKERCGSWMRMKLWPSRSSVQRMRRFLWSASGHTVELFVWEEGLAGVFTHQSYRFTFGFRTGHLCAEEVAAILHEIWHILPRRSMMTGRRIFLCSNYWVQPICQFLHCRAPAPKISRFPDCSCSPDAFQLGLPPKNLEFPDCTYSLVAF